MVSITPATPHDRSGLSSLFSLFDACRDASSRQDFVSRVYPLLREIVPHTMFVCGTADIDSSAGNRVITVNHMENISFPESYLKKIITREGRIDSPLVRHWLRTKAPVYYDERMSNAVLSRTDDSNWKYLFNKYGFHTMAAHGMLDVSGKAASYFCFAGIGDWSPNTRNILELAIPHLHVAFTRQILAPHPADDHLLSPRESEILKLICMGKTTQEIGQILGISPWTVKVHVRNFMSKLNVSTRGHAVAKAMRQGLVGIPRVL